MNRNIVYLVALLFMASLVLAPSASGLASFTNSSPANASFARLSSTTSTSEFDHFECPGIPSLAISPNPAGISSDVDAVVSGLYRCRGFTIAIKDWRGCERGDTIASFISDSNGGSVTFISPHADGLFGYYACIDDRSSRKAILNVSESISNTTTTTTVSTTPTSSTSTSSTSTSSTSTSSTSTSSTSTSSTSTSSTSSTSTSSTSTSSTSTSSTSTTVTSTSSTIPYIDYIISSNATVNQMSTQVLTINVVDSFPDFTYSFLVTNAITANVLFSSVQSNALTSNSASFIVPMEANAIGNVLVTGNVVDSQGYGMQATNTFVIQATTSTNTSTTTTVVTTVPPQIIQSSGEGGSGGGGSTGTAGKHKPMVLQYINGNETGYEILNFSEQDSVTVAYNTTLTVDENFITPSSAGISINGKSISLSPNLRVKFMDTIDYAYFADLTDISYQPTLHLITVLVYRQPTNMGIPPVTTIPATTVSTIPTTVAGEITNTTGSSTTSSSSGGLVPLLPWIGEGVAIAIAIAIGLLYPRRNKQKK